uniref:RND efflux pump membrane fusion protein barrel-sandwich domain-containing protein n=1 Tax=uncultured prokaryote TaxID=198431 RepID=A0A0H5PZB8_9ZZZZ|nr:hypothetical protein [uncultured prokaryote]
MNKKKTILIAVAAIIAAGGSLWLTGGSKPRHKVVYTTATVEKGEISESVTATGTIEPVTEVEVGTQVSGIIDKIYVDYNSVVTRGQLIAEMDRVTLQSELASQRAAYNGAKAEYEYQKKLYQTYVQILYAAESVKVNEATLEVSQAECERARQLLQAGSIARSDLAQLEAQVSTDRYQLVTAQATLQDYKLQLKQLLELDGEAEMNLYLPDLGTENVLAPLPAKADIYRAALALRPEIEAGKLNVETSDLDIRIARAGYLPTLSLTAGIGTSHANGSDFSFSEQVKQNWNNSLGVTLSVPIFSNRQNKSAVEKAKLRKQTSELDLMDEQKTLYKTIETLWLDANSAQQRYAAATEKLRSTQASYDLIQEQFNLGMKNTVELLTEKNNLLGAQQETLQAKYMAILNRQLLRFYQGEEIEL